MSRMAWCAITARRRACGPVPSGVLPSTPRAPCGPPAWPGCRASTAGAGRRWGRRRATRRKRPRPCSRTAAAGWACSANRACFSGSRARRALRRPWGAWTCARRRSRDRTAACICWSCAASASSTRSNATTSSIIAGSTAIRAAPAAACWSTARAPCGSTASSACTARAAPARWGRSSWASAATRNRSCPRMA
ncbi:hypothetical protein D3C72_1134580 [compost metagenome]